MQYLESQPFHVPLGSGATFDANYERTFGKPCAACGTKYKPTDETPDNGRCAACQNPACCPT